MKSLNCHKIDESAYFVVDSIGYFNQIAPFDLQMATQTITNASASNLAEENNGYDDEKEQHS